MIIFLDNSIADSIKNDKKLDEIDSCLAILANEFIRGSHILIGDRQTILEIIFQDKILSDREKKVYIEIYNSLTSMANLINFCSVYMEVTTEVEKNELRQENSTAVLSIPVKEISLKRFANDHYLLCENNTDCNFYEKVFLYYVLKHPQLNNIFRFSGEKRGGGGSTVFKEYQQIQNEGQRFCLCFLDSDQEYPARYNNGKRNYGKTAKDVISIDDQNEINTQYYILPVREMENLIPIFFLQENIDTTDNRYKGVKIIESLINNNCLEGLSFFDFKHGIKGFQILDCGNKVNENPFSTFWLDVTNKIGICPRCEINCDSNKEKKSCNYKVLQGIGDKVMEEFILWMEDTENIRKINKNINGYNRIIWDEISKILFSWFCGLQPSKMFGNPD